MLKKRFLLCALIMVCLAVVPIAAASPTQSEEAVVTSFITQTRAKQFEGAASMFHYPTNFTHAEQSTDQTKVAQALKYLDSMFGEMLELQKVASLAKTCHRFMGVRVMGGDLPYWDLHPGSSQLIFKVKYAKESRGWLIVEVCNLEGQNEIRSVEYSLEVEGDKPHERIEAIWKGLANLD
ncbi:MAG TPA: hypothetical protein VHY08_25790 [Bacillota bacterium]|nr:hypothetical protein [Bacillota bacterium]